MGREEMRQYMWSVWLYFFNYGVKPFKENKIHKEEIIQEQNKIIEETCQRLNI